MKPPCEIIVTKILPNIRALVAIELKETYQLKGREIARLTGTTEAAISQYLHGVRGVQTSFIDDFPEIPIFAAEAAKVLYENRDSEMELTERMGDICSALRNNEKFVELYTQGKKGGSCGICFKGIE
jgi:predicted transcriptional regulator